MNFFNLWALRELGICVTKIVKLHFHFTNKEDLGCDLQSPRGVLGPFGPKAGNRVENELPEPEGPK